MDLDGSSLCLWNLFDWLENTTYVSQLFYHLHKTHVLTIFPDIGRHESSVYCSNALLPNNGQVLTRSRGVVRTVRRVF